MTTTTLTSAPEPEPEMSDADRLAHELASYVRRPVATPDLPKLPRDTAARRRAGLVSVVSPADYERMMRRLREVNERSESRPK